MSVHCVYKNSTEFIELSNKLDIHPDSLEVCVHQFLNSGYAKEYFAQNNDFPFPSEEYVREYFFGGNKASGKQAIRNWVKMFKDTLGETYHLDFQIPNAKQKASDSLKLVNREAIHIYKNNDNKYVLHIARPQLNNTEELIYLLDKLNLINKYQDIYYLPKTITTKKGEIKYNNLDSVIDEFKNNLAKLNIPQDAVILHKNENSVSITFNNDFKDNILYAPSSELLYQRPIQTELNKLRTLNHSLASVGSIKKQKDYIKRSGISPEIVTLIMKAVELDSSLASLAPLTLFNTITKQWEGDLALEYQKYIEKPIDKALEQHLTDFLKPFHIDIKETGLAEEYGVTGIFDILNKTIHLAKNRNSITMTEEFAHAFVRLMGAKVSRKEENKDYTFLFKNVDTTSIYKKVYEEYKDTYINKDGTPNIDKIKEEAIGLALAVAINNKWNNQYEEKESGFWATLKEWINKVLDMFSNTEYINFDSLINLIATEVILKDYSRLKKVDSSNYRLLDYAETVAELNKKDGGKAIEFMQYFTKIGNVITGSFSYRKQGSVYRGKLDSLHDIDMKVPQSAHGINLDSTAVQAALKHYKFGSPDVLNVVKDSEYFKKVFEKYPNLKLDAAYPDGKGGITVNAIYSDNEELKARFSQLSGSYADRLSHFSEDEIGLIYLFGFFLANSEVTDIVTDIDNKITLAGFKDSFGPKLEMSRAKDIFDYLMWELFLDYKNESLSDEDYLMYLKITYDMLNFELKEAVDRVSAFLTNQSHEKNTKTNPDFFLIVGKAGSGKTSIIDSILTRVLNAIGKSPRVFVTAVSNKATLNLLYKIDTEGGILLQAKSTAAVLGLKMAHDESGKEYWYKPKGYDMRKSPAAYTDILFIDEASMISEELLKYLQELKQINPSIKMVFMGDIGLVSPVDDTKDEEAFNLTVSPVFTYENKEEAKLLIRVRLGEKSPVLDYADKYWNFSTGYSAVMPKQINAESRITKEGALVVHRKNDIDIIANTLPLFKQAQETKNPNLIKIVTYTNKTRRAYNNAIYNQLHPEDKDKEIIPYHEGDLIMFYSPYLVSDEASINNSEEFSIKRVNGEPYEIDLLETANTIQQIKGSSKPFKLPKIYVLSITIDWQGHEITLDVLCPNGENIDKYKAAVSEMWQKASGTPEVRKAIIVLIANITNNIGIVEPSYAITVHKSLGSTYDVVVVDAADIHNKKVKIPENKKEDKEYIELAEQYNKEEIARMMYTALTRASNVTVVLTGNAKSPIKALDLNNLNETIKSNKLGKAISSTKKSSATPLLDLVKKVELKEDSWTSIQQQWNDRFTNQQEHIDFVDNEVEHAYYYYPKGKSVSLERIKADTSVTSIVNPIVNRNAWLNVSARIGTSADTIIRDFFMGKDIININYPNLTKEQVQELKNSCQAFKDHLDSFFGDKRYVVRTDTFPLMGKYTDLNGQLKLFGGTVDILIYDEDGNYYIYDIKTSRSDINQDDDKKAHYTAQLNSYREMLELTYPELKGKCKGLNIFQLNTFYATPKGLRYQRLEGTTEYSYDKNLIYADGKLIQEVQTYQAPKLFGNPNDADVVKINKSIIPISLKLPESTYYGTAKDNWGNPIPKHRPIEITSIKDTKTSSEIILSYTPTKFELGMDTFMGMKIEYTPIGERDGRKIGARAIASDRTIKLDMDAMREKWETKAWLTPLRSSAIGVDFNSFEELLTWTMLHESAHIALGHQFSNLDTRTKEDLANIWATERFNKLYNRVKVEQNVSISTEGYTKGLPQLNPDTAYVFTENAQANAEALGLEAIGPTPKNGVKINVSDVNGTNQAGIRTDKEGNLTTNAFGVVVKKFQLNTEGRFVAKEGQFLNNDEDFELFKNLNEAMFDRLENSGLEKIVFPSQMALGKAALPKLFAEWLAKEIYFRYGLRTSVLKNRTEGYDGYGIKLNLPDSKEIQQYDSDTKINIYAGTNENADLSNFAERHFKFTPEDYSFGDDRREYFFNNVEQAFQFYRIKIIELIVDSLNYSVSTGAQEAVRKAKTKNREALLKVAEEILNANTASSARKIGERALPISDVISQFGLVASSQDIIKSALKIWNEQSSKVMKALLKTSFELNPLALQILFDTGNATLTHIQDESKLGTEFPKLLMEVREELRDTSRYFNIANIDSSVVDIEFHDKPWKSDPTKVNKTVRIYIKGQHEKGYFELVKDSEANNYSVHFKTKTEKGLGQEEMLPSTREERDILFELLRNAIPEGAKVSTWGTISEGGISGLNKLGQGMIKVGERTIDRKSDGSKVKIPIFLKVAALFTPEFEAHFSTPTELGYPARTKLNITWSDVTLGFEDGNVERQSPGMILTSKEAISQSKYTDGSIFDDRDSWFSDKDIKRLARNTVVSMQNDLSYSHRGTSLPIKDIKLNIAGNDISKFKNRTQELLNDYITKYIQAMIDEGVTISEIRSGGQTGIDEAAIIAALRLRIPWSVVAPKDWAFRTSEGKDIKNDKNAFMQRFFTDLYKGSEERRVKLILIEAQLAKELALREYDALENDKLDLFIAANPPIQRPTPTTTLIDTTAPSTLLSESELNLIKQRKELVNASQFSGIELKHLAKSCMFLLSNIISLLQNSRDNNKEFLPENHPHYNTDFTGMSRIEIINTIGLNNLFEIVRQKWFNRAKNPNVNNMGRKTLKKLQLIYNNFAAFTEMAYSSLIELELVSIDSMVLSKKVVTGENEEVMGAEDAAEAAEIFGSSAEHWQVEFRLISAFNSLSLLVKTYLNTLIEYNEDGSVKLNEFGIDERVDGLKVVANILEWTQGASTLSEMVERLSSYVDTNPWVKPLIERLGESSKDETFKSQFFSNFKKYFLPYIIQYAETVYDPASGKRVLTGRLINKVINQNTLGKLMLDDYQAKWQTRNEGTLTLFNTNGKINTLVLKRLETAVEIILKFINDDNQTEILDEVKEALKTAYEILDVDIDESTMDKLSNKELIKDLNKSFTYLTKNLRKNEKNENYDIVEKNRSNLTKLFEQVSDTSSNTLESCSFEAGKMHYSYVIPSYTSKMVTKLKGDVKDYDAFIQKEFGYRWFLNANGSWRNELIRLLATNEDGFRDLFKHAVVLSTSTSKKGESKTYTEKSPVLYEKSMLLNYFAEENYAYYRMPMQSNKPSEEYLRMKKYTGSRYKDTITRFLMLVAYLEIDRISTVRERKKNKDAEIKNFDKRGLQFLFLEYLQDYLDTYNNHKNKESLTYEYLQQRNAELNRELQNTSEQKEREEVIADIEKVNKLMLGKYLEESIANPIVISLYKDACEDLLRKAIKDGMEANFLDYIDTLEREGILELDKNNKYLYLTKMGMGESNEEIMESLENFFWNDTLASINILELMVTDIAYYKDTEDLLKRLALLHAPGLRGNLEVKDREGKLVTDGTTRTIYLKDFEHVVSDAIENVRQVFKAKYDAMPKNSPEEKAKAEEYKKTTDALVDSFKDINVTDALGYSSITSYRKKALIFGKWNDLLEDTYLKIKSGNYTTRDLQMAIQPLKPFVYSQANKASSGTLSRLKVGVQNKNSEYMLLMMDAILRGNKENAKLSAIYDIMEESHEDVITPNGRGYRRGIDTVLFESTVKAGLLSAIDINEATNTEEAKLILRNAIYQEGNINGTYNLDVVHELDFEDYAIQSEVPAHLEGESIFGSLLRILAIADMPETINGIDLYITVNGKRMTVKQAKDAYMLAIKENIEESFEELAKEFKLDSLSLAERNIALSRMLLKQIRLDNRYGYDMLYAVSTDEYGRFNIPLSDPIQAGKIQSLLNSIIKNRINKQQIKGGPVVLVTNYGTAADLEIRFKDKDGHSLPTFREFYELLSKKESESKLAKWAGKFSRFTKTTKELISKYSWLEFIEMAKWTKEALDTGDCKPEEYQQYLKEYKPIADRYQQEVASRLNAIEYMECYAPSTVFLEEYPEAVDENGFIDIKKIPKEALELIGFRI